MKISVVIPTKNEAENLPRIVPKIKNALGKDLFEIIAANSPGTDNTNQVAAQLRKKYPQFKLLQCPPGWGNALKLGYAEANGDWILSIDCDFLENEQDIKKVVAKAKQGYDMVIGSRYMPGGELRGYPLSKRISNRIYYFFSRYLLGLPYYDLTNNFKLYKAHIAKDIPFKESHFAASAETGLYPALKGYKIAEVPVLWVQREFGQAGFNLRKMAVSYTRVFFRALKARFLNRF